MKDNTMFVKGSIFEKSDLMLIDSATILGFLLNLKILNQESKQFYKQIGIKYLEEEKINKKQITFTRAKTEEEKQAYCFGKQMHQYDENKYRTLLTYYPEGLLPYCAEIINTASNANTDLVMNVFCAIKTTWRAGNIRCACGRRRLRPRD